MHGQPTVRCWCRRVGLAFIPSTSQYGLGVIPLRSAAGFGVVVVIGSSIVAAGRWRSRGCFALGTPQIFSPSEITVSSVSRHEPFVGDQSHAVFLSEILCTVSNQQVRGDAAQREGLTTSFKDQFGQTNRILDICEVSMSATQRLCSHREHEFRLLGTAPQAPLRPRWSTIVASHSTVPSIAKLLP